MTIFTGAHLIDFLAAVLVAIATRALRAFWRRRRPIAPGHVSDEKRAELRGGSDEP
jgi:hypothetical protein